MYDELISYAEDKARECALQGEDVTAIRYWVGYADGLRAASDTRPTAATLLSAAADIPSGILKTTF